jgi:hypothetical protein
MAKDKNPDYDQNSPAENAEPKVIATPEEVAAKPLAYGMKAMDVINHEDGRTEIVMK